MEVIPIQNAHAEAVGHTLTDAFMDYPVDCYVLPDPERRRKLLLWTYPRWVRAMLAAGEALTTSDFTGAALWRRPESGLWRWLWYQVRAGLLHAPFKLRPGEFLRLGKVNAEATKRMRHSLTSPHWVLDPALHRASGQGYQTAGTDPVDAQVSRKPIKKKMSLLRPPDSGY